MDWDAFLNGKIILLVEPDDYMDFARQCDARNVSWACIGQKATEFTPLSVERGSQVYILFERCSLYQCSSEHLDSDDMEWRRIVRYECSKEEQDVPDIEFDSLMVLLQGGVQE